MHSMELAPDAELEARRQQLMDVGLEGDDLERRLAGLSAGARGGAEAGGGGGGAASRPVREQSAGARIGPAGAGGSGGAASHPVREQSASARGGAGAGGGGGGVDRAHSPERRLVERSGSIASVADVESPMKMPKPVLDVESPMKISRQCSKQSSLLSYACSAHVCRDRREEARQRREDERALIASRARAVGLQWPRCRKKSAGRPSRRHHWMEALYDELEAGNELPDEVGIEPPSWWRTGSKFIRNMDEDLEEVPVAEQEKEEFEAQRETAPVHEEELEMKVEGVERVKKQYKPVSLEAKTWFLDYADLQRRRRNWDIVRSLTEAKVLAPETFGHVHKDTPRKWKRAPPAQRGRAQALSPAALTILSEVVDKVSSAVTIAAREKELEPAGMMERWSVRKSLQRALQDGSWSVPE